MNRLEDEFPSLASISIPEVRRQEVQKVFRELAGWRNYYRNHEPGPKLTPEGTERWLWRTSDLQNCSRCYFHDHLGQVLMVCGRNWIGDESWSPKMACGVEYGEWVSDVGKFAILNCDCYCHELEPPPVAMG
jgi:hypothetical protein